MLRPLGRGASSATRARRTMRRGPQLQLQRLNALDIEYTSVCKEEGNRGGNRAPPPRSALAAAPRSPAARATAARPSTTIFSSSSNSRSVLAQSSNSRAFGLAPHRLHARNRWPIFSESAIARHRPSRFRQSATARNRPSFYVMLYILVLRYEMRQVCHGKYITYM